ncbi:MAG: RrF2 family transcriptional regulator [Alphaproteobacteria bacterium]
MNITKFSDYCLRVLIFLAANDDEKATADQIAKAYDISFHHVAKAAQWLGRENYILSERGRGGGITLASKATEINIGELLAETENHTHLVECMKPAGGACCIRPACGLKLALAEAEAAFYETLRKFTLADVVTQKSALSTLLSSSEL